MPRLAQGTPLLVVTVVTSLSGDERHGTLKSHIEMKINSNWNKTCALAKAFCSSSLGKVLLVELSKGQKMK